MTTPMPADQAAKERPILFRAPMVRAILAGTKTQTRRVVKWQRLSDSDGGKRRIFSDRDVDVADMNRLLSARQRHPCARGFCPYGQPGDRLWVRESFMPMPIGDGRWDIAYAAGGLEAKFTAPAGYNPMLYNYERWAPSIHMPRWASRITLEVTGVRVERLNEISEADCIAEGIDGFEFCGERFWRDYLLTDEEAQCSPALTDPRASYRTLWESINGPGSWAANPWVWAISFRRIDA